jgi:anti-sigma factor RsiW
VTVTCRDLVAKLHDYLDHDLPDEVYARFEHHVSTCPRCGAHVETYRATIRITRHLPKVCPISAAFAAKLESLLQQATGEQPA